MLIADSGSLIALAAVGQLDLPQRLVGDVRVPETVYTECTHDELCPGAQAIRDARAAGVFQVCPALAQPAFAAAHGTDAAVRGAVARPASGGGGVMTHCAGVTALQATPPLQRFLQLRHKPPTSRW